MKRSTMFALISVFLLAPACPASGDKEEITPAYEQAVRDLLGVFGGAAFLDTVMEQMTKVAFPMIKVALEKDLKRPLSPDEEQKIINAYKRTFRAVIPATFWERVAAGARDGTSTR